MVLHAIGIIRKLDHRPLHQSFIVAHIFVYAKATQHYDVVAVKIEEIYSPCVFMTFADIPDTVYEAVLANLLERDYVNGVIKCLYVLI